MPKFDIEISIPPQPGGPMGTLAHRLPMIEATNAVKVLSMMRIRIYSHNEEAFVYDGMPGIISAEAFRLNKVIEKLVECLASEVGETRARLLHLYACKEVAKEEG